MEEALGVACAMVPAPGGCGGGCDEVLIFIGSSGGVVDGWIRIGYSRVRERSSLWLSWSGYQIVEAVSLRSVGGITGGRVGA